MMASRRRPITVPTTASLSPSLRLPSTNPRVRKTLSRLSRSALLSLALEWLSSPHQTLCAPFLLPEADSSDEQDLYPAASTLDELTELYTGLQAQKGVKRDVVDRIVEGDWRQGLTLYQLAEADMRALAEKPASLRWTAMTLVRRGAGAALRERKNESEEEGHLPRFHGPTILRNLQREIGPVYKAVRTWPNLVSAFLGSAGY
jgi:central kinetochore subunit Mis15/CHL4